MVGRQYVSNISSVVDIFYLDTRAVKSKNIKIACMLGIKKKGNRTKAPIQKPPGKKSPDK